MNTSLPDIDPSLPATDPAAMNKFNQLLIDQFRARGGKLSGQLAGAPILLLNTVGAQTGRARTTPLGYIRDEGRYVVAASKAGVPANPDWYYNLAACPTATVETGTGTLDVRSRVAQGEERSRRLPATGGPVADAGQLPAEGHPADPDRGPGAPPVGRNARDFGQAHPWHEVPDRLRGRALGPQPGIHRPHVSGDQGTLGRHGRQRLPCQFPCSNGLRCQPSGSARANLRAQAPETPSQLFEVPNSLLSHTVPGRVRL